MYWYVDGMSWPPIVYRSALVNENAIPRASG